MLDRTTFSSPDRKYGIYQIVHGGVAMSPSSGADITRLGHPAVVFARCCRPPASVLSAAGLRELWEISLTERDTRTTKTNGLLPRRAYAAI